MISFWARKRKWSHDRYTLGEDHVQTLAGIPLSSFTTVNTLRFFFWQLRASFPTLLRAGGAETYIMTSVRRIYVRDCRIFGEQIFLPRGVNLFYPYNFLPLFYLKSPNRSNFVSLHMYVKNVLPNSTEKIFGGNLLLN